MNPVLDQTLTAEAAPPGVPQTPLEPGPSRDLPPDVLSLLGRYRISVSQAAEKLSLSRTSAYRVLHEGVWPQRMTDEAVQAAWDLLVGWVYKRGGMALADVQTVMQPALPEHLRTVIPEPKRRVRGAARPLASAPAAPEEETPMLMAKQSLSPAARKAFGLFSNPFDGEVIDDEQMFVSGEIAYVREACMQAAVGGRFVAVVSESGGGKTTMLQDLESRLQRDRKPVLTIKPWVLGMEDNDTRGKTLKATDILASIVTTLDPLAQPRLTLQSRSDQARDLLVKSTEAGYSHIVVIEEAHSLPEATLKHFKRLHEMRLGRKPLLGILLLGQTELAMRLDPRRASLREVTQRCEVVHLMPLDGDLQPYLEHRAKASGRKLDEFITADGIEEIRTKLTIMRPGPGGKNAARSLLYPLAVNNLVTAALNMAAELGAPVVDRNIVRAV